MMMVSKRYFDPVSTHSDHNPITALTAYGQAPTANFEGACMQRLRRGVQNYSLTTTLPIRCR